VYCGCAGPEGAEGPPAKANGVGAPWEGPEGAEGWGAKGADELGAVGLVAYGSSVE
jgi:hypothetical protein